MIRIIKQEDIDKEKWDECIRKATNSLIYGYSFYLDAMSKWDGIVVNDYEAVMPLTWKRKYGIKYLYQPPFTQQLGLFTSKADAAVLEQIVGTMKAEYKFWEVNFNYATDAGFLKQPLETTSASNYIISLSQGYEAIYKGYHNVLIKNLKKSNKFELQYCPGDYEECIEQFKLQYGKRVKNLQESEYSNFLKACKLAEGKNMLICRKAVAASTIMACVIMLFDGKRLYNIINITPEAGKETEANRFLLDCVIKEFAGKNIILDLEGSEIPGVKAFYEQFGAVNQPYFKVKYNGLAWPFKLLKR